MTTYTTKTQNRNTNLIYIIVTIICGETSNNRFVTSLLRVNIENKQVRKNLCAATLPISVRNLLFIFKLNF